MERDDKLKNKEVSHSGTNKQNIIPDIKSPNMPKSSKEIEETYIDLNILLMYEFKMSYKDICDLPSKVFERMIKFLEKRQESYEKEYKINKRRGRRQ